MNAHQLNQRLLAAEQPIESEDPYRTYRKCIPEVVCKDGVTLSVQAGHTHYCSPRDSVGPWGTVEVGYPSIKPNDAMMEYCEDPSKPTDTVYGYVPIETVVDFINEHGGSRL